jgi:hypothetical protein
VAANEPILQKVTYKKRDRQHEDQKRNIVKNLMRDKAVALLPPLEPCPEKKKRKSLCTCQELIMDVGTQQILRNNYISTVRASKTRDAVNLLLTTYIIPKPGKLRANGSDTRKIRQHYAYRVPRYNSSGEPPKHSTQGTKQSRQ